MQNISNENTQCKNQRVGVVADTHVISKVFFIWFSRKEKLLYVLLAVRMIQSLTGCSVFVQGYMRPLKQPDSSSIVDPLLVDEMFFQIPEILEHHEHFLDQVSDCVNQWHDKQIVGYLLIQSVSKDNCVHLSVLVKFVVKLFEHNGTHLQVRGETTCYWRNVMNTC